MVLIAGLLAVSACEPAPPPAEDLPEFSEAFPDLPLPAGGKVVSRHGSRDALQVVIDVASPADAVAGLYRTNLSGESWRLVSDTKDSTGAVVLYAEGRKPLWIRIAALDPATTRVELSGAVPGRDTTYVRRREAASDTINTMRSRQSPPPGE